MTKVLMKKALVVLCVLALLVSITACGAGKPSPTDVAESFFTALQNFDEEKMATVYLGENLDLAGDLLQEDPQDEFTQQMTEQLLVKLLDFDYELSNEVIDGDRATVDVTITQWSIGSMFISFLQDYFTRAMELAMDGATEAEISEFAFVVLSEKMEEMQKDFIKSATLELEQVDGQWMVSIIAEDSDMFDALTGGMISAMTQFGN